jgi:DNA repair exonuclease SbcCD ATPase subunit
MNALKISRFKIEMITENGPYGFECEFKGSLNIIRGNNSTGKSTLLNALSYSIGMEELLGGQGIKYLPYALKSYLENDKKDKITILSSYVFIELENKLGKKVTLKRSIKSENKNPKLIEVIEGHYIKHPTENFSTIPTYIHDSGSAKNKESGYFKFLESFIGLDLPNVSSTKGGSVKLYLQVIFSALFVEQKRGWTDYLATIPYFAIRDAKTKAIEFILNLDVFQNEQKKDILLDELNTLNKEWSENHANIQLISRNNRITVKGLSLRVDELFNKNLISTYRTLDDTEINTSAYLSELIIKKEKLINKHTETKEQDSKEILRKYNSARDTLDAYIISLDSNTSEIHLTRSRIKEYESSLTGIEEGLSKNKIALKLKKFGAENSLEISKDTCPTCHQRIEDSLLLADTLAQPMTLDENIKYLESQKKMISKYLTGLIKYIKNLKANSSIINSEIEDQKLLCLSIKRDLKSTTSISESDIRSKLQIEDSIRSLTSYLSEIDTLFDKFTTIAKQFSDKKSALSKLPKQKLSSPDHKKIQSFYENFIKLATKFEYESANTDDIEINKDTLIPYLAGIELREIQTDIKSDSSASDFVRLIWAYLLSLSKTDNSNHPNLIILDEPGQHSMGVTSMNALLHTLSTSPKLQSIIGASFDESDDIYKKSIGNYPHHLIHLKGKFLKPKD